MIIIPRSVCIDPEQALNKEWLVANGIGGFASASITGALTRRYHGLLVAALKPPVERTVLFSKVDEQVQIGKRTSFIGTNEYPDGRLYHTGYIHMEEFRLQKGIPITVYRLGGALLSKTVWMEHGHNTTYIRYDYLEGDEECCLVLNPLTNYRDYHSMTRGSLGWTFDVDPVEGGARIKAYGTATPWWLTSSPAAEFTPTGVWYWNFVYRREVDRGFTEREDLYVPGILRVTFQPGESFTLLASTEPPEQTAPLLDGALEREQARHDRLLEMAGLPRHAEAKDAASPFTPVEAAAAQLVLAADQFIVTRGVSDGQETRRVPTVIAGYPWFTDWGRDTMIALPGLTIPTGRTAEALETLRTFALFVRDGLIPNNFPDEDAAPHYNTVDATLWMFATLDQITRATGDLSAARDLYPVLSDIIAWHVRGTHYGIHMDPEDCLLASGEEGVQLTWMDAISGETVVTPRTGKAIEINALWYNALSVMAKLKTTLRRTKERSGEPEPDFRALASKARASFRKRFWYNEGGYLYDVVDTPSGDDSSLRPNQLFALSLGDGLVTKAQAKQVLSVVREQLLTPYGLRTLAPGDPQYKAQYVGDRVERDARYHQGTVWPWLLGTYFDAVRAFEGEDASRAELNRILPALRAHLADEGLGTISEIFDADPPHAPKGCAAQAWSVSEVLRHVWVP